MLGEVLTLLERACLVVVGRRRFLERERERLSFSGGGGGRDTGGPKLEEKCEEGRKKKWAASSCSESSLAYGASAPNPAELELGGDVSPDRAWEWIKV